MDLGIAGKTAIVVGGAGSLGLAVSNRLAAEGVNLILFQRTQATLDAAATQLRATHGINVRTVAGDMTQVADVEKLRSAAKGHGVDILIVNSARPPMPMRDVLDENEDSRWAEAYNGQLLSAILLVRAIVPILVERRWGRVVAITSASVKQPMPHHSLSTVYRAGLTALMKHLANEIADKGVTVNCVCPASVLTDGLKRDWNLAERIARVPMKRLGTTDEFSSAVAYLASVPAGFITGASLQVDGGMTGSLV
jgi:3-oxoacyl-[acyl-carrier protein] reductase